MVAPFLNLPGTGCLQSEALYMEKGLTAKPAALLLQMALQPAAEAFCRRWQQPSCQMPGRG